MCIIIFFFTFADIMMLMSIFRLYLIPVTRRDAQTLIPIIKTLVALGSMIFTDGWGAYLDLNNTGYHHFTVIHKHGYKET